MFFRTYARVLNGTPRGTEIDLNVNDRRERMIRPGRCADAAVPGRDIITDRKRRTRVKCVRVYERNKKKTPLGNRITTNADQSRGGISTDGPTAVRVTQVNEPCALPAYAALLREPVSSCGPYENSRHTCGGHDSVRQHGVSLLFWGKEQGGISLEAVKPRPV